MKKTNKKGFSIVELVIVLAIIAVLAAVLIPTFASLIKKANVSKDNQLIRNLNTALVTDSASKNYAKHETMTDALKAAEAFGYDVGKINVSAVGNEILWDSKNDVFCYLDGTTVRYIPETILVYTKDNEDPEKRLYDVDYWVIKAAPHGTYSTYLYNYTGNGVINDLTTGLDVGNETVTSVSYVGGTSAQTVTIRTTGGTLRIDAANDTVKHYGDLGHALITNVSTSSYYEYGHTLLVEIATGRLVITNATGAYVGTIYLDKLDANSYANIILAVMDSAVLPEIIYRDDITLLNSDKALIATIQQVNEKGVEDSTKTEYIYFYGTKNSHEQTKEYTNVSPLGTLLLEANSGTYDRNLAIASADKEATIQSIISVQVEVTNTAANTIKTMSLAKFRDDWNSGVYAEGDTTVKVLTDFSLEGSNWEPIGTSAQPFYGTFDGNSKTISGLTFSGSAQYCGLIGVAGSHDVTVKDLTLDGVSIANTYSTGTDGYTGALIGFVKNDPIDLTLTAIDVGGSVSSKKHTGGIVGVSYNSGSTLIDSCTTSCAVSGGNGGLASMIGNAYYFSSLTVNNCSTSSALTFSGSDNNVLFLGDFVGFTPTITPEIETLGNIHFTGTNTWENGASITISNSTIKKIYTCLKYADYTLSNVTVIGSTDDSRNAYKLTIDGATFGEKLTNYGDLTVKSGTFSVSSGNCIVNGASNFTNATMTIKNGTFTSAANHTIYNFGDLTIEDGSFSNTKDFTEQNNEEYKKYCIYVASGNVVLKQYTTMDCTYTNGWVSDTIYCITNSYYQLGNVASSTKQTVSGAVSVVSVKKTS